MSFYIIIITLGIFYLFKLLKARYVFKNLKEKNEFHLYKVEEYLSKSPDIPTLYCVRGSIYQTSQNFILANRDFKIALSMIDDNTLYNGKNLKSIILGNIHYTEKPLPWSKGRVKDLSDSWITFFLIERFGNRRFNF